MKAIVLDSFGPPESDCPLYPRSWHSPASAHASGPGVSPVETYQRAEITRNCRRCRGRRARTARHGQAVGEGVTRVARRSCRLAGSVTGTYASHCLVAEADAAAAGARAVAAARRWARRTSPLGARSPPPGAPGKSVPARRERRRRPRAARALGATPITVGVDGRRPRRRRRRGASRRRPLTDDVVRAVLDGTGQAGADVVVEMLMDKNAAADMALVAGGDVAVVGNRGGRRRQLPRADAARGAHRRRDAGGRHRREGRRLPSPPAWSAACSRRR